MLAVLKLEFIGENYYAYKREQKKPERPWYEPLISGTERYGEYLGRDQSRPWVARLAGFDEEQMQFVREFMRGQKDYSQANSTGSRGIYLYYPLKDGLYEVNARETWKRARRYFLLVEQCQMREIEREEAMQWLINSQSG